MSRRAFLLLGLAPAAASRAAAQPGGRRAVLPAGGRRLDLRLDDALPRPEPTRPPVPDPQPAARSPEPGPRAGLSLELERTRSGGRDAAESRAGAAERDALADRLQRLGIEELMIRLTRPL